MSHCLLGWLPGEQEGLPQVGAAAVGYHKGVDFTLARSEVYYARRVAITKVTSRAEKMLNFKDEQVSC